MILDVAPMRKPRMTQRDKWRPSAAASRYFAFRDEVRLRAGKWAPPEHGLWLVFTIPMPKSWSKKKRAEMRGKPHQQTPDIDNLVKAFLDCFGEDKRVWDVRGTKRWGDTGTIQVNQPLT